MYRTDTLKDDLKNKLDDRQQTIALTRTRTGYRRVKGPAGSGKSLALARLTVRRHKNPACQRR